MRCRLSETPHPGDAYALLMTPGGFSRDVDGRVFDSGQHLRRDVFGALHQRGV